MAKRGQHDVVKKHRTVVNALLSNCKQSDREIAKSAKISQPTVTRIRQRLEKTGVIKGYRAIPDYGKIGFQFGAITLGELRPEASLKALLSIESVMLHAPTIDEDSNFVIITFHETMQDYDNFLSRIKALTAPGTLDSTQFYANGVEVTSIQVPTKGA